MTTSRPQNAATLPTILLVDDDPGAIQALGKVLRLLGTLRFATSGKDALHLAAQNVPNLVLLDSEMPGMSGLQVLEAMRRDPLLADVPVIFVTGRTEEEFDEAALALGAVDVLAKPIRPAIVQTRVRTQLRLQQLTERLQSMEPSERGASIS